MQFFAQALWLSCALQFLVWKVWPNYAIDLLVKCRKKLKICVIGFCDWNFDRFLLWLKIKTEFFLSIFSLDSVKLKKNDIRQCLHLYRLSQLVSSTQRPVFLQFLSQPKKMDTATGSGLMEEFELMKQAKYRVYMQNIDKALKNFEYSSEWADLISALGKLNKVSWKKYTKVLRRVALK